MRLAVLMTNTDDSDFSQLHPKDGDKWRRAIANVRPDWHVTVFSVKDNDFPLSLQEFDGAIITGSPASVHDQTPWMGKLAKLIRQAHSMQFPLFGACFGHQAIAMALGGKVTQNPNGWVFGTVNVQPITPPDWMASDPLTQYAAHIEQVTDLPQNAKIVLQGPDCTIGGYILGSHIFCSQYHPEMSHDFIGALVNELTNSKPAEVIDQARRSLAVKAQNKEFMESVAQFFQQAQK